MVLAGAFMGVSIAPAIISSSLLIEKYCPADRLTEGFSLVGSSLGVGFALGASVAGRVDDQHSTHLGFAVGTCAVAVAAVAALLGLRRVGRSALTEPVQDERVALTVPAEC